MPNLSKLYLNLNSYLIDHFIKFAPFPWIPKQDSREANIKRDKLLHAISDYCHYTANKTKLYTGSLSPGCKICVNGDWSCNFINRLCNCDCFFCKRIHSMKIDPQPSTYGITLKTTIEHINLLKSFQIKGVSFSGGEPLLAFDKLIDHITAIRREFDQDIYIWVYTNGILVDRRKLEILQIAGLDELRFNICASGYNLTSVIMARDYIPSITIEIPAIPEDYEIVKNLLIEMQTIGVNFLNLHNITLSRQNWKRIIKRNYHFTKNPDITVYESEICALKLIEFAMNKQLKLQVNYCSHAYKMIFQKRASRTQRARIALKDFQEITEAGYIRELRIVDSPHILKNMIKNINEKNINSSMWQLNLSKSYLSIHLKLMPFVNWDSSRLTIIYYNPDIDFIRNSLGFVEGNLKSNHKVICKVEVCSQFVYKLWNELYIQNKKTDDTIQLLSQYYPVRERNNSRIQKEASKLQQFCKYEKLSEGFPDIY